MKKFYLTFIVVLFVAYETYSQDQIDSATKRTVIYNGINFGSVIAAITSWERNKSVLWAVVHGIFSWFYVLYFVLTRKKGERK
ncbi:hypothetical protein FK178_10295 [Antarcticibacterium arcticum]|uniref:Uncharacterized protein n=1 Tax=Antarcticibacterium arcticum TaxID=2585771 RepID=A0A5B8YQ87_9FLAO|nr:hypothetical protein [Antarcticibacterium arcticum]QED38089.1 hypothetical protein FK178_10295 [Antarcticibacterium arcticum]